MYIRKTFPAFVLALTCLTLSAQKTTRASVSSSGGQGDHISDHSSISDDGRFVAFVSSARNLVPGDTGWDDIFLRDRWTFQTHLVSVSSTGVKGNRHSNWTSMSADGRFVAFTSDADNLVPGDTNGWGDVFVHDVQTKTTTRVSLSSTGAQGDRRSAYYSPPHISATGRYVTFESEATNLVVGDNNGTHDIFVHDRQTQTTTRVSVDSRGAEEVAHSFGSSISADGRFVAFNSHAKSFDPGDSNGYQDTFVRDRQLGTTTRVSVSTSGTEGDRPTHWNYPPCISRDGGLVAFSSWATNLVPGDTNGYADVFVHDLATRVTTRASLSSQGVQGDQDTIPTGFADKGRLVVFFGLASNLVPEDGNAFDDVFLRDRLTNQTTRVSVSSEGVAGINSSILPSISGDGRFLAFTSAAPNLVSGDTNRWEDVFVRERCTLPPAPAHNRLLGQGCKHPTHGAASMGPRYAGTAPYAGERFELLVENLPPKATGYECLGLLGIRELPAPFDLAATGLFLPQCLLHLEIALQLPLARDWPQFNGAVWPLVIPCDAQLIGLKFYTQAAVVDFAQPREWLLTNGYEGTVGAR